MGIPQTTVSLGFLCVSWESSCSAQIPRIDWKFDCEGRFDGFLKHVGKGAFRHVHLQEYGALIFSIYGTLEALVCIQYFLWSMESTVQRHLALNLIF
jgi:hypothetical protein